MRHPARKHAALAALLLAAAAPALAEELVVNSFEDRPDADLGDGVCDADLTEPGQQITLRAAVMHSNLTPEEDTIVLESGTYRLRIAGADEDSAATGDLDVTGALFLRGAGMGATKIDGKKAKDRVLDVHASGSVSMSDLTIQKGKAPAGASGGGLRNRGTIDVHRCAFVGNSAGDDAGALDNDGTATLLEVIFTKNKAKDDAGAIDNDTGSLLLQNAALFRNRAGDEGGAIENESSSGGDFTGMTIVNTTVSSNKAKNDGGGIVNEEGGILNLSGVTVAKNKAKQGGGISNQDATTRTVNSLFAKNKRVNCDGPMQSLGGNLDSGTTCGFGAQDRSGVDPKLRPLRDNGGVTPTHALPEGSAAIDSGNAGACTAADQRNFPRFGICDSGAYEFLPDGVDR